jgi:aspartyl-tRNA(Asn)/glutamyl-tRNA(Gln) amidotransferase subunit B
MSKYIPTIGIETHVQLKTKTKLFAAVGNDARQAAPNTLISHICVGMPGALPVLNRAAVELAMRTAFVLNTKPQKFSKFDRKHYFYPDLPKGYQISQFDQPIIVGGHVDIEVDGQKKKIGITRAHLEEDAGKNIHPAGMDYSLVDLNRAGTPLLEIISEPEIHGPEEAKAYVRELYLLMKYSLVSDCDLYHGNMRFDVNVSVSKDSNKLGTRSEIKNLNSFRSVEGAVAFEIKRQTELLEKGGTVAQETRGWDEAKQKTLSQRGKEEAHDYRYMPEPDIPPIELTDAEIEQAEKSVPELPGQVREKLREIKLEPMVIEDILDRPAALIHTLKVLEAAKPEDARRIAFWFIHGEPPAEGTQEDVTGISVDIDKLVLLSDMVDTGKLSSTAARSVFEEIIKSKDDPQVVAERLNLLQISDEAEIEKIVKEVLLENPKVVADVKTGEQKAIGFLVGQVMKKSAGKANPGLAQKIIRKQLEI